MKRILKNKYFISIIIFTIWMTFFDQNNFMVQQQLGKEQSQLEARKQYYLVKNKELSIRKNELLGNLENLEKLAREKYFMKREDEDLYIVKVEN
ncbi:MAG: septum formation initiator family protein [Flavobacteriales bacterium]|nr:septum formation initiator family protein [Flavobacteriales bacterium]